MTWSGAPDADPAVKPFADNQRNVEPIRATGQTFGSNCTATHAQAEELAGFTGRKDLDTHAPVTYNDTGIQVTSKMTSKEY